MLVFKFIELKSAEFNSINLKTNTGSLRQTIEQSDPTNLEYRLYHGKVEPGFKSINRRLLSLMADESEPAEPRRLIGQYLLRQRNKTNPEN